MGDGVDSHGRGVSADHQAMRRMAAQRQADQGRTMFVVLLHFERHTRARVYNGARSLGDVMNWRAIVEAHEGTKALRVELVVLDE